MIEDDGCLICGRKDDNYIEDERGHKFCSIECQNKWYEMYAEFVDSVISADKMLQLD